jgi:Cu-Zn family superoxide dismutase
MRYIILIPAIMLALSGAAFSVEGPKVATARIIDSKGGAIGSAILSETGEGVKIKLGAGGIPPGMHGFHIHSAGMCEPPDFKSAGGHFNPYGKKHGLKSAEGRHAGDMPNVEAGEDGKVSVDIIVKDVTLGEGVNSLFKPEGTSIVIHANPDDGVSDPAGNAGARIACGVIERLNK